MGETNTVWLNVGVKSEHILISDEVILWPYFVHLSIALRNWANLTSDHNATFQDAKFQMNCYLICNSVLCKLLGLFRSLTGQKKHQQIFNSSAWVILNKTLVTIALLVMCHLKSAHLHTGRESHKSTVTQTVIHSGWRLRQLYRRLVQSSIWLTLLQQPMDFSRAV